MEPAPPRRPMSSSVTSRRLTLGGCVACAPGLLLTAGATAVAIGAHGMAPDASPYVIAVALGALVANTVGIRDTWRAGLRFAGRRLLRVGVVLLGFQLSLQQLGALGAAGVTVVCCSVAATFFGTRWAGRLLGLPDALSLLVATGYSICGASAIAAVEGVVEADEEEVAFAVALVTLCGTLSIVVLPALGHAFGLGAVQYGNWVGASVHDVGQVVATASSHGTAATTAAVIVKLTRVVLLAPLVTALGITKQRRHESVSRIQSADGHMASAPTRRQPIIPLFVIGFLVAIVVRSATPPTAGAKQIMRDLQTLALTAALFGLGSGVHIAKLRRLGGRPLVLGLISWVLVLGVALGATQLIAH